MRPAVVTTLLLLSCAGTAIAEEPPRFDIEATCRSAPSLLPQDRDTYAACMRDEHNARVILERRWARVSAEHRHTCAA